MNDAERLELPHVMDAGEDGRWDVIDGRYYDRSGNAISFRDYMRLNAYYQDHLEYKRVAETAIGDYWVSTVWLGLDHGLGRPYERPLIFETMVFNRATDESDLDCKRYSTEAEAREGHERMVAEVRLIVEATT